LQYRVPARIGDYTDFFTSIHHATRVGQLLRPENPLLPNYKWVPIAYHGRASSIVISGTAIRRPIGQLAARGASEPSFGASGRMDYELELAAYIGVGNALGVTIPLGNAESHVFGFSLLNDWSARDIQAWEAQPLGPFLAKSFATTVSPWIVTMEALEPYRQPWTRPTGDPQPLPYLDDPRLRERGAIDIQMRVALRTEQMRAQGLPAEQISTSNYRDAYWCLAQMVAHHTVAGCNLRPGDLIATGTQSGPELGQSGCLLELTRGGKDAISLASGEQRRFLEDGDEIVMSAFCLATGAASIGFGSCTGTLQAPPGLRAV
jgi:fumarylacetoacetase